MKRISTIAIRSALPALLALFLAPAALAAPRVSDKQVDRMTDAVMKAFPMPRMVEIIRTEKQTWPLNHEPDPDVVPKVECVRSEMTYDVLRRWKREEVVTYSQSHAQRFAHELALLEQVAPVFGELFLAGAENAVEGLPSENKDAAIKKALKSMTPDQMVAMVQLTRDPSYAPLREMIGYGDIFDSKKSDSPNPNAGSSMEILMTKLLARAMKDCGAAPADFL